MEIQRQSDTYGLDVPAPRQAHLSAEQVRDLTAGPQITPGLLNTRTRTAAWEDADPSEQEGVGDMNWGGWMRRNLDENGELIGSPHSKIEREKARRAQENLRDRLYQEWIDGGAPHHGSRTAGSGRPPQGGGIPEEYNDNYYSTDPDDLRREMADDADPHLDQYDDGQLYTEYLKLRAPHGRVHPDDQEWDRMLSEELDRRLGANFGKGPRDHGGAGPDGGPANPPEYYDEDESYEEDDPDFGHDPERFIPGRDVVGYHYAADAEGVTYPTMELGGTVMPTLPLAGAAVRGGIQDMILNEVGLGASATGQEQTPAFNPGPAKTGYHYADIHNKLLQAEGEEIEAIGLYNDFQDEAEEAGDEEAAAAFGEAIQDETDHVHNFGDALRQSYRY